MSHQFRLRSLFILTAIVAVGVWIGPPIVREVRARLWPPKPERIGGGWSGPPELLIENLKQRGILVEESGNDDAPDEASPPTD